MISAYFIAAFLDQIFALGHPLYRCNVGGQNARVTDGGKSVQLRNGMRDMPLVATEIFQIRRIYPLVISSPGYTLTLRTRWW